MDQIFLIAQIIIAVMLTIFIMLQVKGTGFGRAWGGLGGGNSFTRRGLESLIFKSTFVLCALFIAISIASLLF